MKTKSHSVFSARLGALLGLMTAVSVSAQTYSLVVVEKFSGYQQTGVGTTQAATNPYGFAVIAEGSGLSSSNNGTFTSAGGSGTAGGNIVYDSNDNQLVYEQSFASQGALNTAFADGDYTVNVAGTSVVLTLSGSVYPNTPTVTFNQGYWSGNVYYFDPTQDLVITSNSFAAFDQNLNGLIDFSIYATSGSSFNAAVKKFYNDNTSAPDTLTYTLLATNNFVTGQTLEAEVGFISIVDTATDAALSGALVASVYSTFTTFNLQAIPEPSTYALLVGGAGLAIAVWVRRRRR